MMQLDRMRARVSVRIWPSEPPMANVTVYEPPPNCTLEECVERLRDESIYIEWGWTSFLIEAENVHVSYGAPDPTNDLSDENIAMWRRIGI